MAELIQPIRGMNDVLPEQSPGWTAVESAAAAIFDAYGYQRLRIPVLEFDGQVVFEGHLTAADFRARLDEARRARRAREGTGGGT